jgi:tripeptide aminopeptidase
VPRSRRVSRTARSNRRCGRAFPGIATGYTPSYALSGGGADANVFNARGLQCVNLANGALLIHTPDEHVAIADLEGMVDVTLALVDAARTSG